MTMRNLGKYLAATARLGVYVLTCLGILLYVDYRVARATVMERLVGIGYRMAPYLDDHRTTEAPRKVRINGVELYTAVGTSNHPPAFVKRFYQDRYAAKDSGLEDVAVQLKKRGALPPEVTALNQLTFGNENVGGVAAIDFGGPVSLDGLRQRFARFAQTNNVGDIGRLRYVYWERTPEGGTRFLTVWTDDRFSLDRLMPRDRKDAEGTDLDNVPRYPGTQRILSADELGQAQKVVVYAGPGSPQAAEVFYSARMPQHGWKHDPTFRKVADQQGSRAMRFENGKGQEVVLDFSDERHGQGVSVVAIQTR